MEGANRQKLQRQQSDIICDKQCGVAPVLQLDPGLRPVVIGSRRIGRSEPYPIRAISEKEHTSLENKRVGFRVRVRVRVRRSRLHQSCMEQAPTYGTHL